MARAERAGKTGAFVVVGIDKLGMINTAYGCESGDAILVDVAACLDDCLRMSDSVGRLGGDRFGIVLEGRNERDADIVADRVLSAIRGLFVELEVGRIHVSASGRDRKFSLRGAEQSRYSLPTPRARCWTPRRKGAIACMPMR